MVYGLLSNVYDLSVRVWPVSCVHIHPFPFPMEMCNLILSVSALSKEPSTQLDSWTETDKSD